MALKLQHCTFPAGFYYKLKGTVLLLTCSMSNPFEIELAVRDSELDAFGVVNNAMFSVYIEHGEH